MGRGFIQHSMEMKIHADRKEVLDKLKANRSQHLAIVAEAREGYIHAAREALLKKLEEVKSGKIVALTFTLSPPVSYIEAYDTAIQMLELHKADQIELTAVEVRCLVMDEWDWSRSFLEVNKGYSGIANEIAETLGI